MSGRKPKTNEWFISKILNMHGDGVFGFDKCDYSGNRKDVTLFCLECNKYFTTRAMFPLRGCGCSNCRRKKTAIAKTSSTKDFIEKSQKTHKGHYNYDKTVYVRSNKHVIITCKTHGDFSMQASNHLSGQGCKKCFHWDSGLMKNPNRPAIVYLVKIVNIIDGTYFYKVGVTTKEIRFRFYGIANLGFKMEEISHIESTAEACLKIEKSIMNYLELKEMRYKITHLKDTHVGGWTECFTCDEDDLKNIKRMLKYCN